MHALDLIAEARIAEALRNGEFDALPGAGKPLVLDDDRLVPEDVRVVYRILRNAGFLPPELEERKEAAGLRRLLAAATDDAVDENERTSINAKLSLLEARLEARGRALAQDYRARIAAKLGGA